MKIARTVIAALAIMVAAAACDSYPTAPANDSPPIGSGTGTG